MKHFRFEEFDCKCGCGASGMRMDKDLLRALDKARELSGTAFHVSSGIRCPKHNQDIGGVPASSHLNGLAADIYCKTPGSRYVMVRSMLQAGILQIILYENCIYLSNIQRNE